MPLMLLQTKSLLDEEASICVHPFAKAEPS